MLYRITRSPVSFTLAACNACPSAWTGSFAIVDAEAHTLSTGHSTVTETTISDSLFRCTLSPESDPDAGPR